MKKYSENLVLIFIFCFGFSFQFSFVNPPALSPKGWSTAPSGGGVTDKFSDIFLGGGYEINLLPTPQKCLYWIWFWICEKDFEKLKPK